MTFDEGYHRPYRSGDIPPGWLIGTWAVIAVGVIAAIIMLWL